MKPSLPITAVCLLCLLVPLHGECARGSDAQQHAPVDLSQGELEKLVQPISLYPDLLLQQVLAASTFPEQILDAAMYNEQGKDPKAIKEQPWDDSVKGVANYPSVLDMLASDLDWTLTLGFAFINQNEQLRQAIQTMRARAKTVGNLKSSDKQSVIEEQGPNDTTIIRVEPAQPQVVYVPSTTTAAVYEKPVQDSSSWLVPLASFGAGMALGYALGDDHDDNYYYGGGFYGPGFWYGGPVVNNWVDYRHDRWDDAYDFARDREDWRQGNRDDWREYRQDLGRQQQAWRQEQATHPNRVSPEKRAEATTRVNTARSSWQSQSPEQRRATIDQRAATQGARGSLPSNVSRENANARLQDARNNPQVRSRAEAARSNPQVQERARSAASNSSSGQRPSNWNAARSSSSLAGVGSSANAVNRASSRGAVSRGSAGSFSRGGGGRRR
jgi:hypothetical protein